VIVTIHGETRLKDEEIEFILKGTLAKVSKIEIKREGRSGRIKRTDS